MNEVNKEVGPPPPPSVYGARIDTTTLDHGSENILSVYFDNSGHVIGCCDRPYSD